MNVRVCERKEGECVKARTESAKCV